MKPSTPSPDSRFLGIYDAHADAIFRFCLLNTKNRDQAVDITQDTFIKTWEYLSSGKDITHIKPFLYRVAKNLIIDSWRKKKVFSLDVFLEEGMDVKDVQEEEARKLGPIVQEARDMIEKLPPLYRDILIMRFVDGLSLDEISEVTGMTKNAVTVRVHRGLKNLERTLERYERYER